MTADLICGTCHIIALGVATAALAFYFSPEGLSMRYHTLKVDHVFVAHVKRMVRLATEDAFKAGRAMTLRPVECVL